MALLLAIATAELLTAQSPRPSAPNGWSATTPPAHDTASIPDRGVTRVELRLARGSLIVRGTDRSDIELRATRRSTSEDPRAVVMRTSQGNDGVVRVVAVYPSPWLHPARECLLQDEELGDFWHHDITVDVELSIPAHIDLWLRTMRGDAEISDLAGTLDVATNDGDLRLRRLKGGVKAAALGEIHLEWDSFSVSAAHTRRLSAYGGAVRLWIPHGESLRIDDGRVLVAGDREIEVARTEDAQGLSLSMAMGGMGAPIEVDLTRSRLILMPPSRRYVGEPSKEVGHE